MYKNFSIFEMASKKQKFLVLGLFLCVVISLISNLALDLIDDFVNILWFHYGSSNLLWVITITFVIFWLFSLYNLPNIKNQFDKLTNLNKFLIICAMCGVVCSYFLAVLIQVIIIGLDSIYFMDTIGISVVASIVACIFFSFIFRNKNLRNRTSIIIGCLIGTALGLILGVLYSFFIFFVGG